MSEKKWTPGLNAGCFVTSAEYKAYLEGFNEALGKSAAPDLYEALEFTSSILDEITDNKSVIANIDGEDAMRVDTALANTRTALAKARGE